MNTQSHIPGLQPATATPGVFGIFLIIGLVAGILLLIVLLILVSMWAQAKHENGSPEKQLIRLLQQVLIGTQKAPTTQPQTFPNLLCPNCGHAVRANATYCPNCRYSLSPAVPVSRSTMQTSVSELSISDKVLVPPTSSHPQQAVIKEAVLDDLAIRVTLQRLWDKAGRYNPGANLDK